MCHNISYNMVIRVYDTLEYRNYSQKESHFGKIPQKFKERGHWDWKHIFLLTNYLFFLKWLHQGMGQIC